MPLLPGILIDDNISFLSCRVNSLFVTKNFPSGEKSGIITKEMIRIKGG